MNNIITVDQVREGDRIKVTTTDGDRRNSFEGVANHFKRDSFSTAPRWFTAEDWTLWTADDTAVIELLDRPLPKVPNLRNAVATYTGRNSHGNPLNRTAVRDERGVWKAYDDSGVCTRTFSCDAEFAELAGNKENFAVVFGGIK